MSHEPIRARDLKSERIEFMYRGRVPYQSITVIAGWPDGAKGLVCSHIAAEVTTEDTVNVLYCEQERSHRAVVKPRLEAAGADLSRVHLHRIVLPTMMKQLEEWVVKYEIGLIIIDPIASVLGPGISRMTDSIRGVTNPLQDMLERHNAAAIMVEHAIKNVKEGANPLALIGGTGSGLAAAAGIAYAMGADPADETCRILGCIKSNLREKPESMLYEIDTKELDEVGEVPFLLFQKEISFNPMGVFQPKGGARKPGRPADQRAAAAEWIINYLWRKGGPVKASQVYVDASKVGMASKTLKMAAKELGIVINPPGGGKNCTWDLPDEVKELLADGSDADIEEKGDEISRRTDEPDAETEEAATLEDEHGNQEEITDEQIQKWLEGNANDSLA